MTTIKPSQAPLTEAVGTAEDTQNQLVETTTEVQIETTIETTAEAEEVVTTEQTPEVEECADAVAERLEESVNGKSKGELVEMLANLISTNPVQNIRNEVDAIKNAFYKIRRAENAAKQAAEGEEATVENAIEVDADEVQLKELLKSYRERRDEFINISDKIKEENYKTKLEIIEELKGLISSEETLGNTFNRFRELQARWKAAGPVPQQHVKDLWETYNLHVENFYDFVNINKELRDLDWKKNFEAKSALCEQAEALTTAAAVVEAFHKLQKLHDEWREIGPVASEHKEPLWSRFKSASSIINRRHQEYFEGIKEEQLQNLARKEALCVAVEALIAATYESHKAWNKAGEQLLALQAEWRTIGFAPKRDNAQIYERFRAACDKFFEAKRTFYSEVKGDMEENLRHKEALCEQAEALQESSDWKEATERLLALQAEWKQAGTVSRRHADAIWKRFRAACDKFFERKAEHYATIENGYEENLARKEALIEEMLAADVKAGGYDAIKEFQRRWSEIGFVPIKHKEELQKRYKAAVDRLFGLVRGAGREQAMDRFKERVSSMRSSGDKRLRSERERLFNRVRQLEQEIATLENNIGFFSHSKGAEALIADVEEKIAKTKREMADTIEKIKMIDGE